MKRRLEALTYIKVRQQMWARRRGLSFGPRNLRVAGSYDNNLFEPLHPQLKQAFRESFGQELSGKIHSLRSSSALCVNVFQHMLWCFEQGMTDATDAYLQALNLGDWARGGIAEISFEDQSFNIGVGNPSIDLLITTVMGQRIAIESKFCEPYDEPTDHRAFNLIRQSLFDFSSNWRYLRKLETKLLAQPWVERNANNTHHLSLFKKIEGYRRLDCAQLVKTLMGLSRQTHIGDIALVYLWYDVPCREREQLEADIRRFRRYVAYPIHVVAISYQQFIVQLSQLLTDPIHRPYLDYITERYL